MVRLRGPLVLALATALLGGPGVLPAARAAAPEHWITTWAPSPAPAGIDPYLTVAFPTNQATNQSVRMIVRTTSPGTRLRLHFTNRYGSHPVTFGPVRVGVREVGPAVQAGSTRLVLFGGRPVVTIPVGAEAASDPTSLAVGAGTDLAVSVRVVGSSGAVSWHRWANSVGYVSPTNSGDHTADEAGTSYSSVGLSWFWLDGVETDSTYRGTIAALGDSITDGWEVLPDQSETWPDVLAARIQGGPAGERRAVVNAGIAGNEVTGPSTCGSCGAPALSRFGRDVLAWPGVSDLIVFEGTNDLAAGRSARTVIAGLAKVVALARQRGLRVYGATITPRADAGWTPSMEANREVVNQWIRRSGVFNGAFDFDAVLRDRVDPHRLLAAFDSGDALHPNLVGLKALADSIELTRIGR